MIEDGRRGKSLNACSGYDFDGASIDRDAPDIRGTCDFGTRVINDY